MSINHSTILKYLRPQSRHKLTFEEKEMDLPFASGEMDLTFPSEPPKLLDAQTQEEAKNGQQHEGLGLKYHAIQAPTGTLNEGQLSNVSGSSNALNLRGKKRLLPMEELVSEAQPNVFDLNHPQAKSSSEKSRINTKEEAQALILRINTCPKLLPQQSLIFDSCFNKEELRSLGVLGRGSFGIATLYEDNCKQQLVGKRLFPRGQGNDVLIQPNEVHVPLEFSGSGLLPSIFGLEWTGEEAIIVQEFAGLNLFQHLRDASFCERFDKNQNLGLWIMLQIFQGLEMLHKHGVVHRDIKLENICMDSNDRVKIIDFGLARTLQDLQNSGETYKGSTPECLPPDVSYNIVKKKTPDFRTLLNKASDVWGSGIVAASLCMKKYLSGLRLAYLKDPLPDRILSHPNHPSLTYLIKHCLRDDESKRPHAENVVHFLKGELNRLAGIEEGPKPKNKRMLNENDKLKMDAFLKKSNFSDMKVPGRSACILGIQKDLTDSKVRAAGLQKLNNIFPMLVDSPSAPPSTAPPPHVVVEKERQLPNDQAQATLWKVSQSPEHMEVDSDSRSSIKEMDVDEDERPMFPFQANFVDISSACDNLSPVIAPSGARHVNANFQPWNRPPMPVQQMRQITPEWWPSGQQQ